jgi:hypothetical protein
MTAGLVGGGGTWTLAAVRADGRSDFWQSRWSVWNREAPERRIWRVTYGRTGEGRTDDRAEPTLEEMETRLRQTLREIHAFAERQGCTNFAACFANAMDTLATGAAHGYHQDLAPLNALPPKSWRMLDATQAAWVFGGMGSWNDMGFDGAEGKEYDRVSEQLYAAITEAMCVAVNAA